MKLTKDQLLAYREFDKNRYVLVDSYRRGGKTELLRYIIRQHPIESFGIFCPSYAMFKNNFGDLFNSQRKQQEVWMNFDAHILLGDEFIMSPIEGKKIACVTTGFPKVTKWLLKNVKTFDKKELKDIKKYMTKEHYKSEFGNYT